MKLQNIHRSLSIKLLVVFAFISGIYGEQSPGIYGLVSFVTGDATISKGNISTPAKLSMKIETDDVITTGDGLVRIQIADAYICHIEKNSKVVFKTIIEKTDLKAYSMELRKGQVFSRLIPDKNKRSDLIIYTPSVTAAVRGTDFMVSEANGKEKNTDKSVSSGVYVSSGSVDVETNEKKQKINLKSGEQAIVAPGQLIKSILDDYIETKMKILDELKIMKEYNCKLIEEQKEKNRKLLEEFK